MRKFTLKVRNSNLPQPTINEDVSTKRKAVDVASDDVSYDSEDEPKAKRQALIDCRENNKVGLLEFHIIMIVAFFSYF